VQVKYVLTISWGRYVRVTRGGVSAAGTGTRVITRDAWSEKVPWVADVNLCMFAFNRF
jgi:hypothetical protein